MYGGRLCIVFVFIRWEFETLDFSLVDVARYVPNIVFVGGFFDQFEQTEISRYKLQQMYEITLRGFKSQ